MVSNSLEVTVMQVNHATVNQAGNNGLLSFKASAVPGESLFVQMIAVSSYFSC